MNIVTSVFVKSSMIYIQRKNMKKATTKRERKYGKKTEDGIRITKTSNERIVKVMVDHYTILKFNDTDEAKAYIKRKRDEEEEKGTPPTSYIIL